MYLHIAKFLLVINCIYTHSHTIQSPVAESEPHIQWGPCHIDLGREASIMHSTLTAQLKSVKLTEESSFRIQPLCTILEQLTKASVEEEGDPFSSTFEALRVMQTMISKFNSGSANPENSDSSSEYTTPAESRTTSPNHKQSPPPPYVTAQTTRAILGSAVQILNQTTSLLSDNHFPVHLLVPHLIIQEEGCHD